ncbi:allophanate hydrolase [Erwinia sp. E602]|uniref:allophanate hydrolase n=1 Tax=Erwinia sp. E602 TaxID=2675378 RepID=UPI001BAA809C|nr:allophanate hydrolase [Erwinia sp. E602]QUG76767.1 allophanate hydrolase [Erwinia sp. E602]
MSIFSGYTIGEWHQHLSLHASDAATILTDYLASLPSDDEAWIYRATPQQITDQLIPLLAQLHDDPHSLPLFGVPFAVKDNIDIAGWPTTAACPAFSYQAQRDASAVARLKAKGAIVIGKTNLDQFATGLVGVRSPYGAVKNSFDPRYVSGGSSAGSASLVARGLVPFALGTDTAGSGRVPAGFNNIVGLKPTKGWLSASGVVPACRLNDTLSVFALTVADAFLVATLAAGEDAADAYSRRDPACAPAALPPSPLLAIPDEVTFFGDAQAGAAWQAALSQLQALGVRFKTIDFTPFSQLAEQLYTGPWVAERTAAVGSMLDRPGEMDPTVHHIISQGKKFSAVDAWNAEYQRAELSRQINAALGEVDALLVPTSPTIHTLDEMQQEPVRFNSQFGTYTNFTNLADLAALALPAPFRADGLPAGITLIAPAWHDRALADFGQRWQQHLALAPGATARPLPATATPLPPSASHVRVAVVGAHLSGMPLNFQLTSRRAVWVEETTTAPCYRLFALPGGPVKKPGLMRADSDSGRAIVVELWDIPLARFGEFVAEVPAPLGIGSLTLADGRVVKGFICEGLALSNALDITASGGWRHWLATEGSR